MGTDLIAWVTVDGHDKEVGGAMQILWCQEPPVVCLPYSRTLTLTDPTKQNVAKNIKYPYHTHSPLKAVHLLHTTSRPAPLWTMNHTGNSLSSVLPLLYSVVLPCCLAVCRSGCSTTMNLVSVYDNFIMGSNVESKVTSSPILKDSSALGAESKIWFFKNLLVEWWTRQFSNVIV